MLPSKVFLPVLSIQPCAGYLVSMQAVFDAVWGLILQVWRCRTEREGFCRAKIYFSFPLGVKALLTGGLSGISFNSEDAMSERGYAQKILKPKALKW